MTMRTFTIAEVETNNHDKAAWIIIDNKIFDVTGFLEKHPGGIGVLLDQAGKDATQAFEDFGHSEDARLIQKEFLIGEIHESERKQHKITKKMKKTSGKPPSDRFPGDFLVSPLLISATVAMSYYLMLSVWN